MSFRGVFVAVFLGTALIVAAFLVNGRRPEVEVTRPTAALVKATGKCAECHREETGAVVHEFEMQRHNANGRAHLPRLPPASSRPGDAAAPGVRDRHGA